MGKLEEIKKLDGETLTESEFDELFLNECVIDYDYADGDERKVFLEDDSEITVEVVADEEENAPLPSMTEKYLNHIGMSMSDFL